MIKPTNLAVLASLVMMLSDGLVLRGVIGIIFAGRMVAASRVSST